MSPLRRSARTDPPTDRTPDPGSDLTGNRTADQPGDRLDVLLEELVDGDPDVRRRAALALGDVPSAIPALAGRVGVETDRVVREALCSQLSRHDLPAVVDGVIGLLASNDAGVRNAVAQVLARTPVCTAARVPALLGDPDPDVRILTVMLLAGLRLAEAETWLTQLVRTDPDANVTAAAIGELVALAGPACEPDLRAAAQRFPDDPFIGFALTAARPGTDGDRS